MDCEAQLAYFLFLRKVGQIDLVFGVLSGFISRSACALCEADTICATLFNIQTDRYKDRLYRHTDRQRHSILISLYE